MGNTTEIGRGAESVAQAYYEAEGYCLEARNYRTPRGEVDLVLSRGRELLFVEVKGRREFRLDEAWWSRWREKKRRIGHVGRVYLARRPSTGKAVDEFRLEIVYVTQGRVVARFEGEPFW